MHFRLLLCLEFVLVGFKIEREVVSRDLSYRSQERRTIMYFI